MRIEREQDTFSPYLRGYFIDPAQDLRMTNVHPVKRSCGYYRFSDLQRVVDILVDLQKLMEFLGKCVINRSFKAKVHHTW